MLLGLYRDELARLRAAPEQLQALGAASHGLLDGVAEETAAWFLVANLLLNLDETLTIG